MIELRRDIEAAAIGNPVAVTGTSGVGGQMRGLYGFIATTNDFGAGGVAPNPVTNTAPTLGTLRPLVEASLKAVILGAFTNGGDSAVLLVSPSHKTKVSSFTANVQRTNEVAMQPGVSKSKASNDVILQTSFTFYGHDYGVTKVVPDRVMTGAGAGLINTDYLVDYDKLALGQLRPFEKEQLATVGDAKQWQIRTEVTLVVRDEKPLAAIRDLTATGN